MRFHPTAFGLWGCQKLNWLATPLVRDVLHLVLVPPLLGVVAHIDGTERTLPEVVVLTLLRVRLRQPLPHPLPVVLLALLAPVAVELQPLQLKRLNAFVVLRVFLVLSPLTEPALVQLLTAVLLRFVLTRRPLLATLWPRSRPRLRTPAKLLRAQPATTRLRRLVTPMPQLLVLECVYAPERQKQVVRRKRWLPLLPRLPQLLQPLIVRLVIVVRPVLPLAPLNRQRSLGRLVQLRRFVGLQPTPLAQLRPATPVQFAGRPPE